MLTPPTEAQLQPPADAHYEVDVKAENDSFEEAPSVQFLAPSRTTAPEARYQTSPPHLIIRSTAAVGVTAGLTSRENTGMPLSSGIE